MIILERHYVEAAKLIVACEYDLNRRLSAGECRDLLMDNTTWTSDYIREVVSGLTATYGCGAFIMANTR